MFELFVSTFALVFFYGFQMQAVSGGFYRMAFCNSLVISACNLILYRLAPSANSAPEIAGFLLGGPIAIVLSMLTFRRWVVSKQSEKTRIDELEAELRSLKILLSKRVTE